MWASVWASASVSVSAWVSASAWVSVSAWGVGVGVGVAVGVGVGVGTASTVIERVVSDEPCALETDSVIVYGPTSPYVCAPGDRPSTTGEPSPKSQLQLAGAPVDRSATVTSSGTVPDVGVASNAATGGGSGSTRMGRDAESVPCAFVVVSVSV